MLSTNGCSVMGAFFQTLLMCKLSPKATYTRSRFIAKTEL